MTNTTRIGSAFLALLLLLGTFAACSGPNAGTTDTTVPGETTAAPVDGDTTPAETEKKEPKPYSPVIIDIPDDPNLLYNGIRLPEEWPPTNIPSNTSFAEIAVPYLKDAKDGGNHPDVVDIDVGRQLFVDNFLIASTDLTSTPHRAVKYEGNPVLNFHNADTSISVKHGGFFYNAEKGVYEMFFGQSSKLMYLTSKDGIKWNASDAYPVLVPPKGGYMSVVYNETPDESNPRYLCLIRYSNGVWESILGPSKDHEHYNTVIYYSENGQNWRMLSDEGPTSGDATSMIYNPFRQTYIFSLRRSYKTITRARDYVECQDILDVADFQAIKPVFWLRADGKDLRDETQPTFLPEVYSVSAVAYESIMLGAFQIFLGPENGPANLAGIPKITNINLGFSRDGFHYSRPGREPIIESTKVKGSWERGYLHEFNQVCVIVGDELRIYYAGYAGDESKGGNADSVAGTMSHLAIGFATMRRDGFVSLDGSGEVVTRLLRFDEVNDRLFINAKAKSIRAEIRDADGKVISGLSLDDCVPFSGDSTCHELTFKSGKTLADLKGKDFSIRFVVEEGEFYAFWVSDTEDGESGGFLAGGYDAR